MLAAERSSSDLKINSFYVGMHELVVCPVLAHFVGSRNRRCQRIQYQTGDLAGMLPKGRVDRSRSDFLLRDHRFL